MDEEEGRMPKKAPVRAVRAGVDTLDVGAIKHVALLHRSTCTAQLSQRAEAYEVETLRFIIREWQMHDEAIVAVENMVEKMDKLRKLYRI